MRWIFGRIRPWSLLIGLVLLVRAPRVFGQPDTTAAPTPLGQLVDIGGRRLHLHASGAGTPTVIVENGSSSFSIDWALVQSRVSVFTRICTYDRAGFAWSDRGPEDNTVEETVDDLHLLLRRAAVPPPYVLVGHSIGGMYVRAYQRRFPEEVVGLVLVDATPEEDLEYLWHGKSTAGVFLPDDALDSVYAPLILKPPPASELPDEVGEPYNRLPPELQVARLWAQRRFLSHIDMSHSWITAASWRQEFIALRKARLASANVLGDLPLVVVRRGLRTDPVLNQREADLASMSTSGKLVVATKSDHQIHLDEPDLVAQAIRDVVEAARRRKQVRHNGPSHTGS
jgi:pimeloyl-ACP methyl ester carboxylesterase